ncbi:hypothetical protein L596_012484 [Steinernema carpocapsae]|uniref:Uncharacterized protein n=1 Tax=Steinernema carpocapsae TaxID=34508 RepID=A0A4U5NY26_STECR|nr:hypothetical protein L596_012484 [Steinernema carpocapsae]
MRTFILTYDSTLTFTVFFQRRPSPDQATNVKKIVEFTETLKFLLSDRARHKSTHEAEDSKTNILLI